MLNIIFLLLMLVSILMASFTGRMEAVTQATVKSARDAVELALGLVGVMTFFLGIMKVAEQGGLLAILARTLQPVLCRIFPSVPANHPAIGAMIMNLAANFLGLGNAATPFGIKAMMELDKLNETKGTVTNAMVLFLAINTSGLTLLPTTMISLRASAQSVNVAGILFPTWVAGICATLMAILISPLLARLPYYLKKPTVGTATDLSPAEGNSISTLAADASPSGIGPLSPTERIWRTILALLAGLLFLAGLGYTLVYALPLPSSETFRSLVSFWTLPAIILFLLAFGWSRGVKVYDAIIEGGKEGFNVALRILPYLVAILVMVGIFRASGGMELLVRVFSPLASLIGMPAETLPVALLRPLSGSGTLGVVAEIFKTHGPDSFIGIMASVIYGSTETTFYVLAVYLGAVGIKNTRHALPSCLLADASGILAGVWIVRMLF
jgi:spore maturation protein SpmA